MQGSSPLIVILELPVCMLGMVAACNTARSHQIPVPCTPTVQAHQAAQVAEMPQHAWLRNYGV